MDDGKMMMLKLMPEALCQLLETEPWQQIASKVSETCSVNNVTNNNNKCQLTVI